MKAALVKNVEPNNHSPNSDSTRKRYSRDFVLSRKDVSANINFPILLIPARVPRGARKKSQSNDQEGHKLQDGSREDLDVEELDGSHPWHRVNRNQWHTSSSNHNHQPPQQAHGSAHPRQRYPSGPHGDAESFVPVTANAPLRPAPDTRRGGHGDWSRGCAGWRQRSYSGSERSSMVVGQHPRGRGGGLFGVDSDDSHTRGRGRGRGVVPGAGGRFPFQHRGGGPGRGSVTVTHRPNSSTTGTSSVHSRTENTEEFWQDEDWESVGGLDSPGSGITKSRERLNSITHSDLPPVAEQIAPRTETDQLVKNMTNLRVYSKSCSLEPPPGFGIPSMARQSFETPVTAQLVTSSASMPLAAEQTVAQPCLTETTVVDSISPPVSTSSGPIAIATPSPVQWLYVDSAGQIQGPFSNAQMSGWMAAGFLPLGIELRRDCDECFLTLADHMNLAGRVPFWDGYALPPITPSSVNVLAQTLATVKPRWLSGAGVPATTAPACSTPAPSPAVVGASGAPNAVVQTNTATAAAAAAAATAMLFATATLSSQQAARMVAASASGQQQPGINVPSASRLATEASTLAGAVGSLSSSSPLPSSQVPTNLVNGSQEFIRLYTEAQALAAHAAKVEAERKELVEKLAAINSTAAKLLASAPGFPVAPGIEESSMSTGLLPGSLPPGWDLTQSSAPMNQHEQQEAVRPIVTTNAATCTTAAREQTGAVSTEVPTESTRPRTVSTATTGSSDDHQPAPRPIDTHTDDNPAASSPNLDSGYAQVGSTELPELIAAPVEAGAEEEEFTATGTDGKKSGKKKNKKNKKNKMSAEQERQLAWEAEFERRKQAALKRKLAEEAEALRLAEEEAAALAAEQAAIAQEQARLLIEQRKREAQRAKAESQLVQLRLPQSARWGTTAGGVQTPHESSQTGQTPSSLLSIQAAQALEEAEQKRREAIMAEQFAVQLAAAEAVAAPKRPQAWASVVNADSKVAKPVGKAVGARAVVSTGNSLTVTVTNAVPAQAALVKAEFPTLKSQGQPARPKQPQDSNSTRTNHVTKSATSTTTSSSKTASSASAVASTGGASGSAASVTSIWDLPNDGKSDGVGNKSKKQKKKNANLSREAASFAAKEELAHWCESQLSSMPLSGVDLPTLVDLLCELEAADQVVEFIETSLGRSKRTSKFSKAFLEKRAFILNTVP